MSNEMLACFLIIGPEKGWVMGVVQKEIHNSF